MKGLYTVEVGEVETVFRIYGTVQRMLSLQKLPATGQFSARCGGTDMLVMELAYACTGHFGNP